MTNRPPHLCTLIILFISALATPMIAEEPMPMPIPKPQTLTLASYNIKNAFDVFDDPYTSDDANDVKPRRELKAIARTIKIIDPDVMIFCELENVHVLRALVSEFLPDAGYEYIASNPTNSGRGINLGIISRLPIQSITSYRFRTLTLPDDEQTWRYARDLMHITLEAPNGEPLEVFAVHFKSKRDRDGDPNSNRWRLAEAVQTRQIIDDILADRPDALIAVTGDFNDTPDAPPIAALLADDILRDLHRDMPQNKRITYLNKRYRSTIDYIMTSPQLTQYYVPNSADVMHNKKLLHGSDHAPIWATFEFPND